jgi:hypothetical protein
MIMVAIIIGPATANTSTTTGYTAGTGLSFGVGLILGFFGFTGIQFNGSGSATLTSTIAAQLNSAVLPGAGGLSFLPSGRYTTNPATFAGAGSGIFDGGFVTVAKQASATLLGTSTLTGNVAKFIGATFSGSGTLTPTVSLALQAVVGFAGSGGKGAGGP